jgi:hypothetical protein
MCDDPIISDVTEGLGEQWELLKNTYKPYPCGIVMHAVIDACLALRRDHAVRASEIAEIIVCGDQLLLDRGEFVWIQTVPRAPRQRPSGRLTGARGRDGASCQGQYPTATV